MWADDTSPRKQSALEKLMKFLLVLALLSSVAFANEEKKEEHKTEAVTEAVKEEKMAIAPETKEAKKAAYKAAKEACLKENKDLKGKELKDCIVSKNL